MKKNFIAKKKLPILKIALYYFYTFYCAILLIFGFFAVLPLYFLCWQKPSFYKWAIVPNIIWSRWFYILSFTPVKIVGKENLKNLKTYIVCPNHISYMDTPLMTYSLPDFVHFMGKAALGKIPIFGWYFKKLHIPVDRSTGRGRLQAYQKSLEAIQQGIGVLIFPEGGIFTDDPDRMTPFKEGAFKLSIETQTPIVPATILGSFYMLAGEEFMLRPSPQTVIFHPPIFPQNHTVESLRKIVFEQIKSKLPQT
jgi:1-acyl-sn-glycerol-3-phosphate acyltransferase